MLYLYKPSLKSMHFSESRPSDIVLAHARTSGHAPGATPRLARPRPHRGIFTTRRPHGRDTATMFWRHQARMGTTCKRVSGRWGSLHRKVSLDGGTSTLLRATCGVRGVSEKLTTSSVWLAGGCPQPMHRSSAIFHLLATGTVVVKFRRYACHEWLSWARRTCCGRLSVLWRHAGACSQLATAA